MQGTEYGLATRVLCCEALAKAGSPQAGEMRERAAAYAKSLLGYIRDPLFQRTFLSRPVVRALLGSEESVQIQ
jgi:hypothetical protein